MRTRKLIKSGVLQSVIMVAAIVFVQPAQAVCVQSEPVNADPIFSIDANNGCSDIQGQDGCTIKGAVGSCTYTDSSGKGFTVNSALVDGQLIWSLEAGYDHGIDTAMVGGGSRGKNNCGYNYATDVDSGSGGDCKSFNTDGTCAVFQNITSLDVCTDGISDTAPPKEPVAKQLEYCQDPNEDPSILGELDETGIRCPLDANGNQKPVIVCNLEKDKYAWGVVGANEEGTAEDVCCKCGISGDTACFVSDDPVKNEENGCTASLTSNPAEEVILQFQKDAIDPCQKIRSGGKVYKTCW